MVLERKCCVVCVLLLWCPFENPDQQGKGSVTVVICFLWLWSMEWFSTDLFCFTLISGQDSSCAPLYPYKGSRISTRHYDEHMTVEDVWAVGRAQVGGGQHLRTGQHTDHQPCSQVFSLGELQELLALPPSSWKSQISFPPPLFCYCFYGRVLNSWEIMFIYTLHAVSHTSDKSCIRIYCT